ncbi:MAG: DMT family transporter [Saprospiraceae bacterium]
MTSKTIFAKLFELNLAVVFISTSGVLGRYIDMPVPTTTLMRAFIACIILFVYCKIRRFDLNIQSKDRKTIILGGLLLGAHWITYFYSLQLSNVAIALLSLYTFPAITAVLEPILLKEKLLRVHLMLCVMIILGIYLLVPDFNLKNGHFSAVCLGLISAFCYAIRNILIKSKVDHYNQSVLMFRQLVIVSIFLFPVLFLFDHSNIVANLPATLFLAILTTAIGHTLFVSSLRHFSTTSASLMSSLLPVYGIILAVIFLGEYPSMTTLFGGFVILSAVVLESIRVKKLDNSINNDQL